MFSWVEVEWVELPTKQRFQKKSQKSDILKKGTKSNSDMKKKAEGKVDAAADKFIKEFLESLS